MKAIRLGLVTLITGVMLLGIGTSLRLMLHPHPPKQLSWEMSDGTLWTERAERFELKRVSRASSRHAYASVDTSTTSPPQTPRPKKHTATSSSNSQGNVAPTVRSTVTGDVWGALARCESGGNPLSRSAGGRYTGAFQFADATWHSLGYEGSAADHPYETQLEGAKRLQARSGWGQWPRCSRKLGLR